MSYEIDKCVVIPSIIANDGSRKVSKVWNYIGKLKYDEKMVDNDAYYCLECLNTNKKLKKVRNINIISITTFTII